MDCVKLGQLILQLRKEKGLTQREIAEQLNISNKTVSKWECGKGAPDVSLWEGLSAILVADILRLLQGELNPNHVDTGKIDNIRFYVCPNCGNILTSTGKANISCCGRRLSPLSAALETTGHEISVEEMDTDYFIVLQHDMSKKHYISFAAYVYDDRIWFQRFYPEQSPSFRMPVMKGGGNLYLYCTEDNKFSDKSGFEEDKNGIHKEDLIEAKRQIDSTLHKLRETIITFESKENSERYKSQITLAKRRVRAFEIANHLIANEIENS